MEISITKNAETGFMVARSVDGMECFANIGTYDLDSLTAFIKDQFSESRKSDDAKPIHYSLNGGDIGQLRVVRDGDVDTLLSVPDMEYKASDLVAVIRKRLSLGEQWNMLRDLNDRPYRENDQIICNFGQTVKIAKGADRKAEASPSDMVTVTSIQVQMPDKTAPQFLQLPKSAWKASELLAHIRKQLMLSDKWDTLESTHHIYNDDDTVICTGQTLALSQIPF